MYLSNEAAAVVAAANLSKSERIRRLKQQGMRQTDIARALGISDQFVANVVRRMSSGSNVANTARAEELDQVRAQIAEGGRLVIPAAFRAALGVEVGDSVLLRLQNGEIRISTPRTGLLRAQELVRQLVPEGRSLADELIAERRVAAERE